MRKHQAKPTLRAKQWCLPDNIIKRFWTQYLGQRRPLARPQDQVHS
jgi:hypothetical protein